MPFVERGLLLCEKVVQGAGSDSLASKLLRQQAEAGEQMIIDLRPDGDQPIGVFLLARTFQNLRSPMNMQETELLEQVELLAGNTRKKSFRLAAEFIIRHRLRRIVETGCYRGHPAATPQAHIENRNHDGQSTVIFALLARELGCVFDSYDKDPNHVARARALLGLFGLQDSASFHVGDSVDALSRRAEPIDFIYFDSFDHNPNNPLPCQLHQLAEVGAAFGKLQRPAGILLDDCKFETGGKAGLSDPFLRSRGWKLEFDGYQRLFTRLA